jgi:hypothetical protein
MVEYDPSRSSDRRVISGVVGTQVATLYGPVPPQYSLEILEAQYANPGSLAVSAQLLMFSTLQGYTNLGTIQGTIVDAVSVPGGSTVVEGTGEGVVTKVGPGCLLEGLVNAPTSGSLVVKLTARLAPGRGI